MATEGRTHCTDSVNPEWIFLNDGHLTFQQPVSTRSLALLLQHQRGHPNLRRSRQDPLSFWAEPAAGWSFRMHCSRVCRPGWDPHDDLGRAHYTLGLRLFLVLLGAGSSHSTAPQALLRCLVGSDLPAWLPRCTLTRPQWSQLEKSGWKAKERRYNYRVAFLRPSA